MFSLTFRSSDLESKILNKRIRLNAGHIEGLEFGAMILVATTL